MSIKKDITKDKKEKIEQHKKSIKVSSVKQKKESSNSAGNNSKTNSQKSGAKSDDFNDPTGNAHLSDEV